jgi:hypothetical protein
MSQSSNGRRLQRYVEAIAVPGWERDLVGLIALRVMTEADAEQTELRAEVERLKRNTAGLYERAHAAEHALAEERVKVDAAYEAGIRRGRRHAPGPCECDNERFNARRAEKNAREWQLRAEKAEVASRTVTVDVLRDLSRDARIRGDIGKEGGVSRIVTPPQ